MPNLDWNLYICNKNQSFAGNETQVDKFRNFNVRNLLINYLNLIKESIQKQLLTEMVRHTLKCTVNAARFLKCVWPFWEILHLKGYTFWNIQRKTSLLESVYNKVTGLQLSCEYCKIFKNRFFPKTPPVAASEKFINFPGRKISVGEAW